MNDLIDKSPKVIAAISFASLILFVVHEWAYLGVIGIDFLPLYTAYDFISNSIVFAVPTSIGLFILILIVSAFTPRPPSEPGLENNSEQKDNQEEKHNSEEEANSESSFLWRLIKKHILLLPMISIISFSLLITLLTIPPILSSFLIVFAGIFPPMLLFIFLKYDIIDRIGNFGLSLFMILIVLIFVSAGLGHDRAYLVLRGQSDLYNIKMKGEQFGNRKEVLRIIEKGIIVIDRKSKQIEFIPLDRISELTKMIPEKKSKTLLCSWFNVGCNYWLKINSRARLGLTSSP